jgi:hypothetical protein
MPGALPAFRDFHPNYVNPDKAALADIKDEDNDINTYDSYNIITSAIQDTEGDLKMLQEAQSSVDWPLWKEAMDRKIVTLEHAGTWTTVPCPTGKNIVGSKWVFRRKRNTDGSIEKYKARLVVCSFTQIFSEDYFDTFSPVAKLSSFQSILMLAARYDWEIKSFDFNSAYLNGELEENEEIYMQGPPVASAAHAIAASKGCTQEPTKFT